MSRFKIGYVPSDLKNYAREDAEQTVACWRSIQDDVARERRIAAARHSAG